MISDWYSFYECLFEKYNKSMKSSQTNQRILPLIWTNRRLNLKSCTLQNWALFHWQNWKRRRETVERILRLANGHWCDKTGCRWAYWCFLISL